MTRIPYYHVDVFSSEPLAGNGLIVFTNGFSDEIMLLLTQEMRQFESIFLQRIEGHNVRARIFTCEEELDFAGHPILGAAATLHDLLENQQEKADWTFELNKKSFHVITRRKGAGFEGTMNQGKAEFGKVLNEEETTDILRHIDAKPEDLYPGLYPTVVSTGLPYLIIPFRNNQFRARIGAPGLEKMLRPLGALFIGILDIETRSIRTGNNEGTIEDIATGSLAGPSGAFLVHHGLERPDHVIKINQGRNLSRKSELYVEVKGDSAEIFVTGSVCKIANGHLEPLALVRDEEGFPL